MGLILNGCATVASSFDPELGANQIAQNSALKKESIQGELFKLTAFYRLNAPQEPLTIYIEGDGRAWLSKNELSQDPTPLNPLMLRLAAQDKAANIAYLGRPCQYGGTAYETPCESAYWSNKRFSGEVVDSMNTAISFLANKSGSSTIHLVGYSGGGAIAVLVAAQRQDIASIRTLAGNLDPDAVNRHHSVDALKGSLNPLDSAKNLSMIPQKHFIGDGDKVVPAFVSENYRKNSGNSACVKIISLQGVTHHKGWEKYQKEISDIPEKCSE